MVKIVGRDETAVKCITCREYAAILEYTTNEVKEHHGTDYGGGSDGTEWIFCPPCAPRIIIRSR